MAKKRQKFDPDPEEGLEDMVKAGGVAMGVIEEILNNKEEILVALLKVLEGRETKAKVDLDGVKFNVGKSQVRMEGAVEFTFVPLKKR